MSPKATLWEKRERSPRPGHDHQDLTSILRFRREAGKRLVPEKHLLPATGPTLKKKDRGEKIVALSAHDFPDAPRKGETMKRIMLKTKIHPARVTETSRDDEGGLCLPGDLMEAAGLLPFEKVSVDNVSNDERFSTYLIKGQPGSTTVGVYGPAANRAQPGDKLVVVDYAILDEEETEFFLPRVLLLDADNRIIEIN